MLSLEAKAAEKGKLLTIQKELTQKGSKDYFSDNICDFVHGRRI